MDNRPRARHADQPGKIDEILGGVGYCGKGSAVLTPFFFWTVGIYVPKHVSTSSTEVGPELTEMLD